MVHFSLLPCFAISHEPTAKNEDFLFMKKKLKSKEHP
jgi:hypothetical protein